ncbi:PHD finger domain protein [Penicillium brasilianum]|uniref:PHD finger domain protein n=1 Tax=Penicillium brasilianum TaxID=104259 RepID=A0A1S9RB32_PENBI|nr:PHD finger domain protein [Penicillium brasilianum]
MGPRKRSRSEAIDAPEAQITEEPGLLQRIRSSWEFANIMQYIHIFGKIMKIDEDFGIEDLEDECLKPEPSYKLLEIGLCLLKWISSHRGLTFENFDEYTRRQYNAKAPHIPNPFGYEETPLRFLDFDVFTKLTVLHQLSVWTFWNPDRLREKMPEKKDSEQLEWRIEEFGYDHDGRSYYVLDDNRLYRRTDPPIPAPLRPKKKPKSRSSRGSRASRRVSAMIVDEASEDENKDEDDANANANVFPNFKWECVAVTLPEYNAFLDTIRKSKDADDKYLRSQIEEHILPLLEKAEEAQQRKRIKREKELIQMQMLAGAKRSSRLAAKEEKERVDREAAEAARKREADLAEARKEQARQKEMENERKSRMMTREQRIKDREHKRILHEAEVERLAAEQEKLERGEGRVSARHLKAEMERSQKNLAELDEEDNWIFDCSGCGVHGENLDDGSHSVACEKCNVWQHSSCLGIKKEDAEKDDFHFVCADCKRKEEEANRPKLPPLKFRVSATPSPSAAGVKPKIDAQGRVPPSPVKHTHNALSSIQNGPSRQQGSQPALPSLTAQNQHFAQGQHQFYVPPSPQRLPRPANNSSLPSSSPPRPPFSPSKVSNGPAQPFTTQQPRFAPGPGQHVLPPMQAGPHLPPIASFSSTRPSSSHSGYGPTQNHPSMSPTQGNHDVGPLAGVPSGAPMNGWSSFDSYATPRPQSGHGATPAMSHNYPSFSSVATPNGNHSSPPHSSHGIGMSGISPTKQSPRPITAGGMAGAPVLPPIRRLEPSPKLMGRSSPEAPIPAPMKCMTPEQEERRQRENASLLHNGQSFSANGQANLMSSPTMSRIPSLGPAAHTQHPEPIPSPQNGGHSARQ